MFGEEFSSVTGYVIEDVFFGHIFVNNEMYYVDPFKVLFNISASYLIINFFVLEYFSEFEEQW